MILFAREVFRRDRATHFGGVQGEVSAGLAKVPTVRSDQLGTQQYRVHSDSLPKRHPEFGTRGAVAPLCCFDLQSLWQYPSNKSRRIGSQFGRQRDEIRKIWNLSHQTNRVLIFRLALP